MRALSPFPGAGFSHAVSLAQNAMYFLINAVMTTMVEPKLAQSTAQVRKRPPGPPRLHMSDFYFRSPISTQQMNVECSDG